MHLTKYSFKLLFLVDFFCYILTYPWIAMLSLFLSCFWSTTEEMKKPSVKFKHYLIYAPVLAILELAIFPFAFVGYLTWIIVCNSEFSRLALFTCQLICLFSVFHVPDYAVLNLDDDKDEIPINKDSKYTFVSGNLLLGIESLGKFQNMPFVYDRLSNICQSFRTINRKFGGQDLPEPISNAPILEDRGSSDEELMDTSVSQRWPHVDFMCFQEVWDRYFTYKLVNSLHPRFKHFVIDVAHHSWSSNVYFGSKFDFYGQNHLIFKYLTRGREI